jgi:2,4-dienoyl-CoA reductase-like NADH-dependent reductase (Old Yellow Enzyme family)
MATLFDTTKLGSLSLANRFIRSATWEGLAAPNGAVTPRLIDRMVVLAQGQAGLIISGHTYVTPEGQASPNQLGVHDDSLLPGLRELTEAVHAHGGTILLQLAHAGYFADETRTGRRPLIVSRTAACAQKSCEELSLERIHGLVRAFGQAALRAQKAGFDGVQLHAAHGYLLSQFLSPAFNQRADEYGGSLDNRIRILREIYEATRSLVGNKFPLLVKLNCKDFVNHGLTIQESVEAARRLARTGFDAVEVSGGLVSGGKLSPSCRDILEPRKESYFKKFAAKIKPGLACPLILVGGNRSPETMQRLLDEGTAEYFSLSRPLICEPDLIKRWGSGDTKKSRCISCNLCFQPGFEGKGVHCVARAQNTI